MMDDPEGSQVLSETPRRMPAKRPTTPEIPAEPVGTDQQDYLRRSKGGLAPVVHQCKWCSGALLHCTA